MAGEDVSTPAPEAPLTPQAAKAADALATSEVLEVSGKVVDLRSGEVVAQPAQAPAPITEAESRELLAGARRALEEAESLCSRIAMLKAGRVVALDSTANLLRRFSSHALRLRLAPGALLPPAAALRATEKDGICSLSFDRFDEIEPILAELRVAGCTLEELEIGKPDLEEVFIRVMHGLQGDRG